MLDSRIFQLFRNVFSGREERPYVPVPIHEDSSRQLPPKDNYRIVYCIFFLQGITMLLGWNVFINASVFFHESFLGSVYADNFQNYFSLAFMSSNLFFLGIALFTRKPANCSRRIIIAITLMTLDFLLITISTQHVEFFGPTAYFYFVITLMVIAGAATAFHQNEIFALVSYFSPVYTVVVMSGQGLAGSAIAFSQILSALTTPPSTSFKMSTENDLSRSALLYFLCTFITALLTLASYLILIRLPLFQYYTSQAIMAQNVETTYDTNSFKAVFYKIRTLVFTVVFVFTVTLSLFPSITASIKSVVKDGDDKLHQDYLFIPLHFLIFNLGDWLGRSLPSLQFFNIADSAKLARMSIARIIFLPMFLICNVDVGLNGTRILPLIINSDLIYFSILALFAISNGYVGSLTMMAAPQVEGVTRDLAGTIMSFFLVLGLAIGSIFSFPIRAISCNCNPLGN